MAAPPSEGRVPRSGAQARIAQEVQARQERIAQENREQQERTARESKEREERIAQEVKEEQRRIHAEQLRLLALALPALELEGGLRRHEDAAGQAELQRLAKGSTLRLGGGEEDAWRVGRLLGEGTSADAVPSSTPTRESVRVVAFAIS